MNFHLPVLQAAAFIFILSGSAGVSRAASLAVPAGPRLSTGESWNYDSGLKITFLRVVSDTRKVTARAGERGRAVIQLRLEAGHQAPKTVRLRTRPGRDYVVVAANQFPEGVVGIPKSYGIRVAALTPGPVRRVGLRRMRAYAVRLAVEVAQ